MMAVEDRPALAAGNTIVLSFGRRRRLRSTGAPVRGTVSGRRGERGDRPRPSVVAASSTIGRAHGVGDRQRGHGAKGDRSASSVKRTHRARRQGAGFIVFDDADLEAVVASMRMAGFYNAGQDHRRVQDLCRGIYERRWPTWAAP